MNKNVKKPSNYTYSEESKSKRMESKMKEKKDTIRTNHMYNKVLNKLEIDELENFDDVEYDMFESHSKIKK